MLITRLTRLPTRHELTHSLLSLFKFFKNVILWYLGNNELPLYISYIIIHPSLFDICIISWLNAFILGPFEKTIQPFIYTCKKNEICKHCIWHFISQFYGACSMFPRKRSVTSFNFGNKTRDKSGPAKFFWRESIRQIFFLLCWERIWQIQTDSWGISWNCRLAEIHETQSNENLLLIHELKACKTDFVF